MIANIKGQMKSDCMYEIINFPKHCRKDLIYFCPESLFRLGMLCSMHSPETNQNKLHVPSL